MIVLISILCLLFSCFIINMFSDKLGEVLDAIAEKYNISPAVRGALFEGVSSSIPELLTSVVAALAVLGTFSGKPDPTAFAEVGVGTIGGSAVFNILMIPFLSLLFAPKECVDNLDIDKASVMRDLQYYIGAMGMLGVTSYFGRIRPVDGACMTLSYIAYVATSVIKDRKASMQTTAGTTIEVDIEEENELAKEPISALILLSLVALVPIGSAVYTAVLSAEKLGHHFGIPRIIMSLIVLAATTSIPDTLMSIRSAKKGELDASIANAVGSNTFDILIGLGAVLAFSGITVEVNFSEVAFIFIFLTIAAISYAAAFMFTKNNKVRLALLGVPYLAFVWYIVNMVL